MTTFTVLGGAQFKATIRRLERASDGRELRRKLASALRDAGRPVVADMQNAIRTMDIHGVKNTGSRHRPVTGLGSRRRAAFMAVHGRRGSTGLRATVARGVKQSVRTTGNTVGWTIFVSNRQMPQSQRKLPQHLGNPNGWRHPTFGNRSARGWVRQFGEPYFHVTIRRHRGRLRAAAKDAVDDALKGIL